MKTKKYITATLIAMIFTTAALFAQSARRPASQERKERPSATRTQTREVKEQKTQATQHSRQVNKQQANRQRNTQPARRVQTQQVQKQRNTQPARQANTKQAQVQKQRKAQPARQANTKQAQVQRQGHTQPARQANTQQAKVQRQRTAQPARQANTQQAQRQRGVEKNRQHANVTTSHNPRSSYRKPDSKVYVDNNGKRPYRANKFASERYYGGHHYHYAYPTRKVNFHYHHDTYLHNYHVLYYPTYNNIYWTRHMYRNYRRWYPDYTWNYRYGYRIQTISVFDTKYMLGEVANVYGRVYATWYNKETNDYLLFFGGDYPYQQFTVVLPARIARKFSWRPERYFLGEHITITGLITTYDGSPEIVVKDRHQIGVY